MQKITVEQKKTAGTFSQQLADYVVGIEYKSLPSDVLDMTRKVILDLIGVAIVGSTTPWAKAMINVVKTLGGNDASYFTGQKKISSVNAALVNGTMAHSHDFDDVHNASATHPAAAIVPAALATAEKAGASGKDVITAIVVGYEIMIRVAEALVPENHYKRGFHPTATCGTFGAAVAAGKIIGLNSDQLANALGICGSSAAGLMEFLSDGAMTKRFHPGKAANLGMLAAYLAEQGFTGPRTVFEGRDGVLHAYTDNPAPSKLTDNLGVEFKILETSFKPYACCRCCHSPIDAFKAILSENKLEAEDVESVVAKTNTWSARIISEPKEKKYTPTSMLEAQMSLPYSLAVVAFTGKAGLKQFEKETVHDSKILTWSRRVNPVTDAILDKESKSNPSMIPAIVEVKTTNGAKFSKRVDYAKGDPENPMTWEEHQEKFLDCATTVFTSAKAKRIIEAVSGLEKRGNIDELLSHLRTAK